LLELPVKNRLFGVCGKTNRIFRIAQTPYDAITIVDILIEKFQCEEKDRCLNVKCPLNKSTARSLHVYRKDFAKLPIEDQYPGLAEKLEQSFKDHPKGGFIIGAVSKDQPFEWPPPIRD
jgi:hypothetical protein